MIKKVIILIFIVCNSNTLFAQLTYGTTGLLHEGIGSLQAVGI